MCPALLSVGWWLSGFARVAHRMQTKKVATMTSTTTNGEEISISDPSTSDYQKPYKLPEVAAAPGPSYK
jgi:hypothetical protein